MSCVPRYLLRLFTVMLLLLLLTFMLPWLRTVLLEAGHIPQIENLALFNLELRKVLKPSQSRRQHHEQSPAPF